MKIDLIHSETFNNNISLTDKNIILQEAIDEFVGVNDKIINIQLSKDRFFITIESGINFFDKIRELATEETLYDIPRREFSSKSFKDCKILAATNDKWNGLFEIKEKQKYTLSDLEHLRNVRLLGFKPNDMMDDIYTNDFQSFRNETRLFLYWLKKMEDKDKINELLSSKP